MTTIDIQAPPFPLPAGHFFGLSLSGDLRFHDGKHDIRESACLSNWQARYRSFWASKLEVTGRYDGWTQRAAATVQEALGIPQTGWIDRDTWDALWTHRRPVREPEPEPPAKPKRISKETWDYWRKTAQYDITYGQHPEDPAWFPGRPFGRHESGWHVRCVQDLLGVKPTGRFNADTERRVRGWQQMHGLPASGVVDSATARALDPQMERPPSEILESEEGQPQ